MINEETINKLICFAIGVIFGIYLSMAFFVRFI